MVHGLRRRAGDRSGCTARRHPADDPQVPVFALGRYAGARRRAIVAMKDRGRTEVSSLSRSLAVGIHRLLQWGLLDVPLTIVAAPTRGWSARHRGGEPVTRIARLATADHPDITVVRALRMARWLATRPGSTVPPANATSWPGATDPPAPASRRRAVAGRRHRHDRGDGRRVRAGVAGGRGPGDGCAGAGCSVTVCEELATGRPK